MTNIIRDLHIGSQINAAYIARLSGQNQVKGIHTIKDELGNIECVAILCTINGESYANEWLDNGSALKYYFYGLKQNGVKKFSPDYQDNQAVINSKGNYPIYAFVRNKSGELFNFEGQFELMDISEDIDGAMYFILNKGRNSSHSITRIAVEDNENFPEGKEKERLHKYKERNPAVIKKAKEGFKARYGRLHCEVCGFDFERTYGGIGADYIEGHHTKPVSELEEESMTNVDDILLVCANCHRMLHRKRPCLSKDELYNFINRE